MTTSYVAVTAISLLVPMGMSCDCLLTASVWKTTVVRDLWIDVWMVAG